MNQTLVYPARVGTRVRSAGGKYQVNSWKVGDRITASGDDKQSQRLGTVIGVNKKITITWENGLSAEYTPKQMQSYGYQKFLEEKTDLSTTSNAYGVLRLRFEIISPKKYLGEKGCFSGYHRDGSPEFWVKLDNYDLQIRVFPNQVKFLEEEGAIAECNSHNLISAQELVQDSALQDCNLDLTLSEPQRLTNTAQISLNCDIQKLTTTETCKVSRNAPPGSIPVDTFAPTLEILIYDQDQSIYLQLPHPAPHSPQKDSDSEQLTSVTVSPQSLKLSENCSPNSSPSKTLQDSSPAPINQTQTTSIFHTYSDSLPSAGTMRNGLLSEAAILPAPTLEKDYCWLRSPGALSLSGKGRPPGQTKQEAELKKLGLINKGEVLNPVILCQWYEIPNSWLDPSESRAATELLEECDRQQEIFSILESQRSPLTELSISTQSQRKVSRGEYPPGELCKKSKLTPEIFLEETQPQPEAVQKPKGRQCKGCLYKYLENKKLKDGAIASYPRVIGHRSPDNPAHWRWGFNWEIKDQDGEWKGRSIGSVPLGAIALIQSMQNEGVSLEEIIGFIKRAKSKK